MHSERVPVFHEVPAPNIEHLKFINYPHSYYAMYLRRYRYGFLLP